MQRRACGGRRSAPHAHSVWQHPRGQAS